MDLSPFEPASLTELGDQAAKKDVDEPADLKSDEEEPGDANRVEMEPAIIIIIVRSVSQARPLSRKKAGLHM